MSAGLIDANFNAPDDAVLAREPAGVVLSWLFNTETSGWFTYSVADLLRWDAQGPQHIVGANGGIISLSSGPRIAEARNQIVDIFAERHPASQWLLMVDSDMTFSADLLERLMTVADPVEAPIVGGLCFAGGRQSDPYPTIYRSVQKDGYASIDRVYDYPRDTLVRVGATGGACLLIHRNALGAMKQKFGTKDDGTINPYPWFAEGIFGPEGEPWGEDIIFCLRAGALGIPVHVHTGVKLGHVKTHIIDEEFYDNRRRARELTEQGAFDEPQRDPIPDYPVKPNRAQRRAAARGRM